MSVPAPIPDLPHRSCSGRSAVYLRFAALLWVGLTACTARGDDVRTRLELVELRALPVPLATALAGVSALDTATVAVWGGTELYMLSGPREPLRLATGGMRIVGVGFVPGGEIEVADAVGRRIVHYAADGRRLRERPVSVPVQLTGAVSVRGSWMVSGTDSLRYAVFSLEADGSTRLIHQRFSRDSARIAPSVHLSAAGGDLLLTELEPPYTMQRIDPRGRLVQTLEPGAEVLPAPGSGSVEFADRWISLPGVFFGDGYVQTLADLTSDRRVLVAYAADGTRVSATLVDAPVGVASATRDMRYLVGSRGASRPDVVLYGWRWRNNPPTGDSR